MANETKVGLTAFTVLAGVFGYVLYGKYEHRLAELAGGAGVVADAGAGGEPEPAAGDAAAPTGDGDMAAAATPPSQNPDFGGDPDFGDEPPLEPEPDAALAADAAGFDDPDAAWAEVAPAAPAADAVVVADGGASVDFGDADLWGTDADAPAAVADAGGTDAFFPEEPAGPAAFEEPAEFGEVVPVDAAGVTIAGAGDAAVAPDGDGGSDAAAAFWSDDADLAAVPPDIADGGSFDAADDDAWGLPAETADAAAAFAEDVGAAAEQFGGDAGAAADLFADAATAETGETGGAIADLANRAGDAAATAADAFVVENSPAGGDAGVASNDLFADAAGAFEASSKTAADAADFAADAATDAAEEALPLFFADEPPPAVERSEPALAAAPPADAGPFADAFPADPPATAVLLGGATRGGGGRRRPVRGRCRILKRPPRLRGRAMTFWGDAAEPELPVPTETAPALAAGDGTGVRAGQRDPTPRRRGSRTRTFPPAEVAAADPPPLEAGPAGPRRPAARRRGGSSRPPPGPRPHSDAGAATGPVRDRAVRPAAAAVPSRLTWSGPDDRKIATVRPGETYWAISKRCYGAAKYFKALARYNARRITDPRKLKPGMKVVCPPPAVLRPYDPDLLAEAERRANPAPKTSDGFGVDERGRPVFVVGPGDTLGGIARTTLGKASRWRQIHAMNRDKIRDPARLKPGTLLDLPPDAGGVRRR